MPTTNASAPAWTPSPGKALALRSCRRARYGPAGGSLVGWGNFAWPETPGATVEAPDWDPTPRCGGGLHGLLWGTGDLQYLGDEESSTYLVVEVDEADVVAREGGEGWDKVKFPRATVVHVGDFASCASLISQHAPDSTKRLDELGELSNFEHKLYAVDLEDARDEYAEEGDIELREQVPPGPFARVISSELTDSEAAHLADEPMHTLVLDIDWNAQLVPSSTSGHHHLYIDVPLTWAQYEPLLKALAAAGVIQEGYYRASVARRGTHLRLPWVRKSVGPAETQAVTS